MGFKLNRSFLILCLLLSSALQGVGQSYYSLFRPKPPTGGGGTPVDRIDYVDASNEDHEEPTTGVRNGPSGDINSSDLELGNDGSIAQNVGMFFDSLNIPAGATIDSVFIQFEVDNTSINDPLSVVIRCQEGTTPAVFVQETNNILGRDKTETGVTWTLTGGTWSPVGNQGPDQRTPNFAAALQETVDNPSYVQGDPIVVFIMNNGGGEREAESWDGTGTGTGSPWIHVYWTE